MAEERAAMKLHEMPADMILEELERRADAYVEAKYKSDQLEAWHDKVKAGVFVALRKAGGGSVEDCKAAAIDARETLDALDEYLKAAMEKDKAYMALERARTAAEMWRSEQANRRRV